MQEIKKETDFEKDENTRKRKRDWQRAKTLKLKTAKIERMEQEKIELGNQVIVKTVDENNTYFCVEFYKLQKFYQDNNLVAYSNWMSDIQNVNSDFLEIYERYTNR